MKKELLYVGSDVSVLVKLNELFPDGSVRSVSTAFGAIEWIEKCENLPGVILVDDNLSLVSGVSLRGILSKEYDLRKIVFIVLTEKVSSSLLEISKSRLVDDVWVKPLQPQIQAKRLDWLLTYKREKQENILKRSKERGISLAKRSFDVFFSVLALLLLSPLFLLVAILIKLDSKGPVFYAAKRVGTGYNVFPFYKFRSMRTDADHLLEKMKHLNQYAKSEAGDKGNSCSKCQSLGKPCSQILYIDGKEICERQWILKNKSNQDHAFVKISNDPRVTRLGHFLRNSSIDELPQLYNIFLGHMSFVGNRPLPLYEAEQLTTDKASERFLAPAGLTGLWQVTKRGKKDMDAEERRELDNIYARTHTFWGDIKLMLKTIPALLQKDNV